MQTAQQDAITAAAADIQEWADLTGIALPYPASLIATMEAAGLVVDLVTGAAQPATPSAAILPTAAGAALVQEAQP